MLGQELGLLSNPIDYKHSSVTYFLKYKIWCSSLSPKMTAGRYRTYVESVVNLLTSVVTIAFGKRCF